MITLDTNIYVYAIDAGEPVKGPLALTLADRAREAGSPLALQVCGEFYAAARRLAGRAPWEAAQAARNLLAAHPTFGASRAAATRALAEAAAGRFSYWDALLLASAAEAGCRVLITEDMADGAELGGVEIVHPFSGAALSGRVTELLDGLGPSRT